MEQFLNEALKVLEAQLPFIISLTLCILANTFAGAIKHTKMSDFNFKAMIVGALKYIAIIIVILDLVVALNLYQPLYDKFAEDLDTLQVAIVIGAFAKVVIQIKEYFGVTEEDIVAVKNDIDNQNMLG